MKQNYIMMFLLIVGVQLLICNYLHVSTFLTLSILPCAILLMPTRYSPVVAMLLAFVSGLAVDTLAECPCTRAGGRGPQVDLRFHLRKRIDLDRRRRFNDEVRNG